MELILLVMALIVLDVLAVTLGVDSRRLGERGWWPADGSAGAQRLMDL